MCLAYIAGLIGPGDRKSIQSLAARTDANPYDRLHHFIGAGLRDSAPLEASLLSQAAYRRQQGLADHRRYGLAREGQSFGRCGPAICNGARQECELSDDGFGNARIGRSDHHAEPAPVPAGKLDRRCGADDQKLASLSLCRATAQSPRSLWRKSTAQSLPIKAIDDLSIIHPMKLSRQSIYRQRKYLTDNFPDVCKSSKINLMIVVAIVACIA